MSKGIHFKASNLWHDRYPESVRKIYIVNPPGVFSMAMGLLKPFLDERTLQKFANGCMPPDDPELTSDSSKRLHEGVEGSDW